jgi:hypothetical protein
MNDGLIVFLQHYERAEDASKAVDKLDDTEFMGVHIQVQVKFYNLDLKNSLCLSMIIYPAVNFHLLPLNSTPKAKENPMLVIMNALNVDEKAIGKIK